MNYKKIFPVFFLILNLSVLELPAEKGTEIITGIGRKANGETEYKKLNMGLDNFIGGNAEELIHDSIAKASQIAAQFPRLRTRLGTASTDYGAAPEDSFEFGLQAILDGLEARLTATPSRPERSRNEAATGERPRTKTTPQAR